MDEKNTHAVERLFINNAFNTRLIAVEAARKVAVTNQLIFGALIFSARILTYILGIGVFISLILFFSGSGGHHLFNSIIGVAAIIGLRRCIKLADARIQSFVNKHITLLFYLRKEVIEGFIKIIFSSAEQIIFDPQVSSTNEMKSALSNLFYNNFSQYKQINTLSFMVNKQPFKIAQVEPIFAVGSAKESTEIDKFTNSRNREAVCFCKGIIYQMDYVKENINTDYSTFFIPKKVPSSPTKTIKSAGTRIEVSKDYPWLNFLSRKKGRPDRFIQRGCEEYSVENIEMEDDFYVFTNNETASRKLLSYRMMEFIVTATTHKLNEIARPKLVNFILGTQQDIPNFWIEFSSTTRRNSHPVQKLTVLSTNRNLTFFDGTGEKSCTFEYFQQNFQKLESSLDLIVAKLNNFPIN